MLIKLKTLFPKTFYICARFFYGPTLESKDVWFWLLMFTIVISHFSGREGLTEG